jgi:transposase-like protein
MAVMNLEGGFIMAVKNKANAVGAEALGDSAGGSSDGSPEGSAFWALAVETWRAEGLSVSEFCRREGLNVSSFYRWRRKLKTEARAKAVGDTVPAGMSSRHDAAADSLGHESRTEERVSSSEEQNDLPSGSMFVPLSLESDVGKVGGAKAGSGVEILIDSHRDSRRVLRVERGFDRATLQAVLSVLEAGAC